MIDKNEFKIVDTSENSIKYIALLLLWRSFYESSKTNIVICNNLSEIELIKEKVLNEYMYICNKYQFTKIKKQLDKSIIFSNNSKILFKEPFEITTFNGYTLIYFNRY